MATTGSPRNASLLTQPPADPTIPLFSAGESGSRPVAPVKGYVYSNTTDLTVEQWTGSVWKVVGKIPDVQIPIGGGPTSQRPANPRLGYLYTDVTIGQLVSWTGTTWLVIGPGSTPTPVLAPPIIVTQPSSQTVTAPSAATFTVAAVGTGVLSYQWFKNSVTIGGATASSYSIGTTSQADGGSYTVRVTDSQGTVLSQAAVLTVAGAPFIVSDPVSQTVATGGSASFTVTATGTAPLSYQWKSSGVEISGANSSTYAINSVTLADAGSYTCTVTNGSGSATSAVATLAVSTPVVGARWRTFTGAFAVGANAISSTILGMTITGAAGATTVTQSVVPTSGTLPPGVQLVLRDNAGSINYVVTSEGGEASLGSSFPNISDGAYTVEVYNPGAPIVMTGTVELTEGPGRFNNCSLRATVSGASVWPPVGFAMALSTTTLTDGAYVDLGFYQGESSSVPIVAPYTWDLGGDTVNNPVLGFFPGGPSVSLTGRAPSTGGGAARLEITAP